MEVNNWNSSAVTRAETTWGHTFPAYTLDMFNFAVDSGKSWLDLGCGFGRFLEFLLTKIDEPDYIGYDSSQDMIDRISARFPHYKHRTFLHNITDPISNNQQVIICSAVLIHITLADQYKVLTNISNSEPKAVVFDINSPSEKWLEKGTHFERIIGPSPGFRMTWQSHYLMTKQVLSLFPKYSLSIKFYTVNKTRNKVLYYLNKS